MRAETSGSTSAMPADDANILIGISTMEESTPKLNVVSINLFCGISTNSLVTQRHFILPIFLTVFQQLEV